MLARTLRSGPQNAQALYSWLDDEVATQDCGISHDWAFGENRIRVRVFGANRSPYIRALEPFAGTAARQVAFTIDVIDAGACGVPWPGVRFEKADFGRNQRLPGWSDTNFTCFALRVEKGIAVADFGASRAIVWLPSLNRLPGFERAAPFRWLAEGFAARRGQCLLHCASIGANGKAVLIVGSGGAGKSTLALSALSAGWDYFGDDYALVSAEQRPRAWRIYRSAKWVRQGPVLPDWIDPEAGEAADAVDHKRMLFLAAEHSALFTRSGQVKALVRPRIDADATSPRIKLGHPTTIAMSAVRSTICQTEVPGAPSFGLLSRIARLRSCYELRLSPDTRANLDTLRLCLQGTA